jgi:ArsR family transcriptional regulator
MKKDKKYYLQTLRQVFRVLSDETRLRILISLQGGEKHVTELCKGLELRQPTVSHHLALLRMQGLVQNRRAGKLVYYSVDTEKYTEASEAIAKLFGH